jgi:hypothetical protein
MPHLHDNLAAVGMHRVGHALPAVERFLAVEAGNVGIALALVGDGGGFGDDQAGGGALGVIFDVEIVRHGARRAVAGQRGHDDAVLDGDVADLGWFEELAHGKSFPRLLWGQEDHSAGAGMTALPLAER